MLTIHLVLFLPLSCYNKKRQKKKKHCLIFPFYSFQLTHKLLFQVTKVMKRSLPGAVMLEPTSVGSVNALTDTTDSPVSAVPRIYSLLETWRLVAGRIILPLQFVTTGNWRSEIRNTSSRNFNKIFNIIIILKNLFWVIGWSATVWNKLIW